MNVFECLNNITLCHQLYRSAPCLRSLPENRCMEDQDTCLINKEDQTKCICSPCFIGDHCETELSKNLWQVGIPHDKSTVGPVLISSIIGYIFIVLFLLNSLLCLQTYLCKKIRQTNLGIYLIMLSIISLLMGLSRVMLLSILLRFTFKELERYISLPSIFCRYNKYIYASLVSMFNWFTAAVAIERALVGCSIKYGLHDSRHRSVIFSFIIVIACFSSTLPGVFTVRNILSTSSPVLQGISCLLLTPTGSIIYQTIQSIHRFALYFIYIVMNIIVLTKLVMRRQRFVDNNSLFDQIVLIFSKHKDFFIPYLIQTICQLPFTVMDYIMTCSTANTMSVAYMFLICDALQFLPFILLFYMYVNLSPVYLAIFWDSSPVGRFLVKIKHKLQNVYENRMNHNSILLETYT